jgi:FkbM family methyltransferase
MIPDDVKAALKQQNPEVFDDVIDKNGYQVQPSEIEGRNVLDVGANIGCFSVLAASLGAKRVLSFEPNHENFLNLCSNVSQFRAIHPLEFAVHNGLSETCNLSGTGDGCEVNTISTGDTQVVTLAQAMALLPTNDNDLVLKMDTEGSEYDALYYAGGSIVRRFKTIFIEIHSKETVKKLNHYLTAADTLKNFMEFCGYKYTYIRHMVWIPFDKDGKQMPEKIHPCLEVAKFERI